DTPFNGYSGEDSVRSQYGGAFGGPVVRNRVFYFLSGERQRGHGTALHHFVVPASSERGLRVNQDVHNGFIPIDQLQDFFSDPDRTINYSASAGESIFSLYPLPNNPDGPFKDHNYSQVEPFIADSDAFSIRLDSYPWEKHGLSARYNYTQDHS